ncbi:MAG: CPBP family intramembrane glutamic endopeptidase, partial [Caldilineaceae bacterium]
RQRGERFYSSVVIKSITPRNRQELLLVLLAMGPVVLLEELLFRSLLIGGFQAVIPLPLLLVGWSIIFGLLHSPQGWWGMVGAGLAGLLFGMLFVKQGSLVLPLVAHYVTNSLQVVQAMRLGYGVDPSPIEPLVEESLE